MLSDDRESWTISHANKIGRQKSVVCHAKISRFCRPIKSSDVIIQHRTRSILDDKTGQLWTWVTMMIVYSGRWIFISVIYFVCYSLMFSFIRRGKNNASIILRFALCYCAFVKLADIVQSCRRYNRPCVKAQRFYPPILSRN